MLGARLIHANPNIGPAFHDKYLLDSQRKLSNAFYGANEFFETDTLCTLINYKYFTNWWFQGRKNGRRYQIVDLKFCNVYP